MAGQLADSRTAEPWLVPEWRAAATDWIETELHRLGRSVVAPIEQPHVRPWSTVLRVPTESGPVFFKATSPLVAHEVGVAALVARVRPENSPELLAIDFERHWLLLGDAGARVREQVRSDRNLRLWCAVQPVYAELQFDPGGRIDDLLALGVPDHRLSALPEHYAALLGDREAFHLDRPEGLTSSEYQRLVELTPRVGQLCGELATYGIPDSLNHGDLHDGNVFQSAAGRFVFIDWGDSVVSHAFFSVRTALVSAEISLDLEEYAPATEAALEPIREAYLDPWARFGSPEQLRRALGLAVRLASINGALGWHRIVSGTTGSAAAEHAWTVPALLLEFLRGEESA